MSWEPIDPPAMAPGALGAVRVGDRWVIRGIASAFACVPGENASRWETDFGDASMAIGPMAVVPAGGAVATLVEEGDESCAVVALDPETGRQTWKTPLKIHPGAYGLAALDGWVLVSGTVAGPKGRLFALAADDGAVRYETPTALANGVRVAGGRALVPGRDGGVYAVTPGEGKPRRIAALSAQLTAGGDGALFAYVAADQAVVELDAATGQELGRVALDPTGVKPSELHALARKGYALLRGGRSTRVLDVRGGKEVSALRLPEGMRAIAAAPTPHGVAVAYRGTSVRENGVGVYDPETGAPTQDLAVARGLASGIFFGGGQLAVSVGGIIRFFAWTGPRRGKSGGARRAP